MWVVIRTYRQLRLEHSLSLRASHLTHFCLSLVLLPRLKNADSSSVWPMGTASGSLKTTMMSQIMNQMMNRLTIASIILPFLFHQSLH